MGAPATHSWPLLEVGPDLVGAGQVTARRVVRAPAHRQHPRVEPDDRLVVGVAGGGQTRAHDALGLHEVSHREQDAGQEQLGNTVSSLRDRPLVQVACMLVEAAQVSSLPGRSPA